MWRFLIGVLIAFGFAILMVFATDRDLDNMYWGQALAMCVGVVAYFAGMALAVVCLCIPGWDSCHESSCDF